MNFNDFWNDKPTTNQKYVLLFCAAVCITMVIIVLLASVNGFSNYVAMDSPSLEDSKSLCILSVCALGFCCGIGFKFWLIMKRIDWLYRWELEKQTTESAGAAP